ncbi:MAG: hypothetical protein ACK5NG_06245 [Chthoniobacterales bacterium]
MNCRISKATLLIFIAAVLTVFLGACTSVSDTRRFYTPTGKIFRSPKAKNTVTPILFAEPDLAYQKMGTLEFASTRPWSYFEKAIRFNAREQGADAAIIRERRVDSNITSFEVPPSVDYRPFWRTVYYRDNRGRLCATEVVDYLPVYVPGYIGQELVVTTFMKADLVVFKEPEN